MVAITRICRGEICELCDEGGGPERGRRQQRPMPAADSIAPAVSALKGPTQQRHATEPSMTVVATPLPDTVPRRNPAMVTDRPGAATDRPLAFNAHSMKKRLAPLASAAHRRS